MPVEFFRANSNTPQPIQPPQTVPQEPTPTGTPDQSPPMPFPGEPLDAPAADPGPQPHDPGADLPPANLEQVRGIRDASLALATDSIVNTFQVGRHQLAMIEMLCGVGSMVNLTIAAIKSMHAEDMRVMSAVTGSLIMSLRDLTRALEDKQPPLFN